MMGIFSKKSKHIERRASFFMGGGQVLTEQEYVDREFQNIKELIEKGFDGINNRFVRADKELDELQEKTEALKQAGTKDFLMIYPHKISELCGDLYEPDDARKFARSNGFVYVKAYEIAGELWVRE